MFGYHQYPNAINAGIKKLEFCKTYTITLTFKLRKNCDQSIVRIKEFVCFLQENEKLFRMPVCSYDDICYRIRLSYHNCKPI